MNRKSFKAFHTGASCRVGAGGEGEEIKIGSFAFSTQQESGLSRKSAIEAYLST